MITEANIEKDATIWEGFGKVPLSLIYKPDISGKIITDEFDAGEKYVYVIIGQSPPGVYVQPTQDNDELYKDVIFTL